MSNKNVTDQSLGQNTDDKKEDINIEKLTIQITIDFGEICPHVYFGHFNIEHKDFSRDSKSLLDGIKHIIAYLKNKYNKVICNKLTIDIFSRNHDFTMNNKDTSKDYSILLNMKDFDFIEYNYSVIKIEGIHDHNSDKWLKDWDTKDKDFSHNVELYDDAIKNGLINSRVNLECGIVSNNKVNTLEIINCKVTRDTIISSTGKIRETIFDNVDLYNGWGYDFLNHDAQYLIIKNFTFIKEFEDENSIDFFPIKEERDYKQIRKLAREGLYSETEYKNCVINKYILIFENCIFNIPIKYEYREHEEYERLDCKSTEFHNCTFNKSIDLKSCNFEQLMFVKCTFNKQIYLEASILNYFTIVESIFHTNTVFKFLRVKELFLLESNHFLSPASFTKSIFSGAIFFNNNIFEKNVDFTHCYFNGYINIATSVFKDIITLQSIKFFKDKEADYPEILYEIYNYKAYFSATFKNKQNFQTDMLPIDRYLKYYKYNKPYYKGTEIPLEELLNNFKSSMAIFKNNLEKINNYIDANKFYSLEMMAYGKYLQYLIQKDTKDQETDKYSYKSIYKIFKKGNLLLDYALFFMNWLVSRHYQSMFWALIAWFSIPFIASLFYNSSISANFQFAFFMTILFGIAIFSYYFNWVALRNYQRVLWVLFVFFIISFIATSVYNIYISENCFMKTFNRIAFPFYDIENTFNNSFIINLLKTTEIYVIWNLIRTAMINFKR